MQQNKIIYADNHSTTEIDPSVGSVIIRYLMNMDLHGNPSSLDHNHGMTAAIALRRARNTLAKFVNAESAENIIFTSGATESNNMVLQFYKDVLMTPMEHKSVWNCITDQKRLFIPLKDDLSVNFDELLELVENNSIELISCMGASNEIGTIFPIHEIGAFCKTHEIKFHCDATQLAPWAKIDVQADNIDFLSMSAHKMYGPKGVGVLYAKNPENLDSFLLGGNQEFTKRPGTQNMFGILAFAKAVELVESQRDDDSYKVALIRSKMEKIFHENFEDVDFRINGGNNRIPNNLSITFYGLRPGLLELVNRKISVSSSSACNQGSSELSHTLQWLGHTEDSQTLRIGLGRFITEEEGNTITEVIIDAVRTLQE